MSSRDSGAQEHIQPCQNGLRYTTQIPTGWMMNHGDVALQLRARQPSKAAAKRVGGLLSLNHCASILRQTIGMSKLFGGHDV